MLVNAIDHPGVGKRRRKGGNGNEGRSIARSPFCSKMLVKKKWNKRVVGTCRNSLVVFIRRPCSFPLPTVLFAVLFAAPYNCAFFYFQMVIPCFGEHILYVRRYSKRV